MPSIFHYDYFSLRNADILAWHKSFFWPVARDETHRLTVDFTAAYVELLGPLASTFPGDCGLAGIMLPVFFIRAVNHHAVVTRLARMGCTIQHSDRLRLVPALMRADEPRSFVPSCLPAAPASGRITSNTLGKGRRFLHSLWRNRSRWFKALDHLDPSRCILAFNSDTVLSRPCSSGNSDWVRVFSPHEWHGAVGNVPVSAQAELDGVAEGFTAFAAAYARDALDAPLPPALTTALRAYARETLADISRCYAGITDLMNRLRPRHLFTPTGGNPFTRTASLAARRAGTHVTGFPHGYYICHSDSPRLAFHEMATVDSFMAYTPGSVPLFERNLAHNPPPQGNTVTIQHDNTPTLRDHWHAFARKPHPERIRTVMVLELSLVPEWAGYHIAESMVNYHFYRTLCSRLSELGYDVVFKRRPKDLDWDGVNIFLDIPRLRVVYEPFEAPGVLDGVDAVVFQYGMSSTMHWSMCTNKHLIFVDSGWEPWFSDVYERMALRCRVLPCTYDERNRAVFRDEDLLAALEPFPGLPDTSYLEAYLFPDA